MKVLMLQSYYGGIGYWRFETPAKALTEAGVDVFCPSADAINKLTEQAGSFAAYLDMNVPRYDLVHCGYNPKLDVAKVLLETCRRHKVPLIVDLDDNLDAIPTYNAGWSSFYPGSTGQRVTKTFLKHADHVTFSTSTLAKALSYLNPNHTVLENWVNVDGWDHPTPPERALDKGVRLMITGGKGRYGDWEILHEPLESLMRTYPQLRLFFLGATPDWVRQWMSSSSDPAANRAFYLQSTHNVPLFNQLVRYVSPDIIISPTTKNVFNASKSPLKFYEASLAGAAFVCTDFDTYAIAPNDCCLRVDNTPTQWREAISALIDDSHRRDRLVDRAKSWVLANADIKDHIMDRITLYEQVVREAKCRLSPPPVGLEVSSAPEAN